MATIDQEQEHNNGQEGNEFGENGNENDEE